MRLTSDCPDFPYGYPGKVCYFEVQPAGQPTLTQARTREDIRAATQRALAGESEMYAVWPGQYRSDLFRVDDLPALGRAVKA